MGCFLSEPPMVARQTRPRLGGPARAAEAWSCCTGRRLSLPPASILPPITGHTCQQARRTPRLSAAPRRRLRSRQGRITWQVCPLLCAWHLTFHLRSPPKSPSRSINHLSVNTQKPGHLESRTRVLTAPPAGSVPLTGGRSPSHRRRMPCSCSWLCLGPWHLLCQRGVSSCETGRT